MDQFVVVIKLLQTMTYFRSLQPTEKLSMTANIRSDFQTANGAIDNYIINIVILGHP